MYIYYIVYFLCTPIFTSCVRDSFSEIIIMQQNIYPYWLEGADTGFSTVVCLGWGIKQYYKAYFYVHYDL